MEMRPLLLWRVGVIAAAFAIFLPCDCTSLLQLGTTFQSLVAAAPDSIQLKVGDVSTALRMPALGFGTCCREGAKGEAITKSTAKYLEHGGKLVDTAIVYQNHRDVGSAIQTAVKSGIISRDKLWVTSKIAPNLASTSSQAMDMLDQSLQDLQLDYVDLFLIHAPGSNSVEIWKGLVQAKAQGKAKAIGVSNFGPKEIQELENAGLERPSVNQIEFHPWVDKDVFENVAWCQSHGVAITAYGSVGNNYHKGLENERVKKVAKSHDKTPAQVLLRWALHQGVAVVPGATSEEHIVEDLQALSFDLTPQEADAHFFQ